MIQEDIRAKEIKELYKRWEDARSDWDTSAREDIDFYLGNHFTNNETDELQKKHINEVMNSDEIEEVEGMDAKIKIDSEDLKMNFFSSGHKVIHMPTLSITSANMKPINTKDYDGLCDFNKNVDNCIGLCMLISYLYEKKLIDDVIIDTIDILFHNIILDDDDICFKYISCMYNIFETLDKSYIVKYDERLKSLKDSKISKKNKFIIMDILEMV